MLLPPYDTRTTLERLAKAHRAVRACAGGRARRQFPSGRIRRTAGRAKTSDFCSALQQGREWFWICGNHDPHLPASIGGTVCATLTIRGVTLRHEPSAAPAAREIAGHLHPVARIARRGARDPPPLLRHRRPPPGDAGLRRLTRAGSTCSTRRSGRCFCANALEAWMMGRADVYPVLGSLLAAGLRLNRGGRRPSRQAREHGDQDREHPVNKGMAEGEPVDYVLEAGLCSLRACSGSGSENPVAEQIDVGGIAADRNIHRQADGAPEQAAADKDDAVVDAPGTASASLSGGSPPSERSARRDRLLLSLPKSILVSPTPSVLSVSSDVIARVGRVDSAA